MIQVTTIFAFYSKNKQESRYKISVIAASDSAVTTI
ncbi:hypothetical protein V6Z11_A07G175900 [Gossypium hirsutum]